MKLRRDLSPSRRWEEEAAPAVMEGLEPRELLASVPFPLLSELTNPNHTVVRMDTNLGVIDIELFDVGANSAPITTANFIGYIKRGAYDQSFFHRSAAVGDPPNESPFVVQGGGFRFINGTGVSTIPTVGAIQNEFSASRSNQVRTIAMAKLGSDPNSATDQFFFNMRDNSGSPAFLDTQNGGFTVFARVVNDSSWSVVLAIAALETRDLRQSMSNGAMDEVPVVAGTPATPTPSESILVTLRDIEVIKTANIQEYFTQTTLYPEGFAGSKINEFVPMENPNDTALTYQVIARAETAQGTAANGFTWFRDKVITTGTIPAHSRGGITVSHFGTNGAPSADDLVPQGVAYALEVQSTGVLVASMSHFDFGTATGEAFSRTPGTTWAFGDATKQTGTNGVSDFLVWQNTGIDAATIDITFYFGSQAPTTLQVTTKGQRRGGLNLNQISQVPNNTRFAVRMTSSEPIVAALTHFDQRTAGDPQGSATLGLAGQGSHFGVLPQGSIGPGASELLGVVNTGNVAIIVNLTFTYSDPNLQPLQRPAAVIVQAQRTGVVDLTQIPLNDGRVYSIRYDLLPAGTTGYVHWVHSQSFTGISNVDAISNPVADTAATTWRYAEGFMDPARAGHDVFETISLFNPNHQAFGAPNTTANVVLKFVYTDGFVLTQPAVAISAGGRLDVDIHALQAVLSQGTTNHRFFYSIEVVSDIVVVSQMRHFDLTLGGLQPSGGFATLGTPFGTITRLDALAGGGG